MRMLFGKNKSTLADVLRNKNLEQTLPTHGVHRVFTQDGEQKPFDKSPEDAGHLLTPLPSQAAAVAVIHHSLPLFSSNWSRAFVEHIANGVVEGGMVVLPEPRRSRSPLLHVRDLTAILGPPARSLEIDSRNYLVFIAPPQTNTPSTLQWAIKEQDSLRDGERDRRKLIERFEVGSRPEQLEILMAEGSVIGPPDKTLHASVDSNYAAALFTYFHVAVAPKMMLMSRLAGEVDITRPLHHVDVGGGMGNLGAELILDSSTPVETSVNVEFDAARMIMGRSLLKMYESELTGKWSFQLKFAQDYAFQEQADIVSMIGSMLYLPREGLVPCMDRAWDSLNPGGILVFYEHIKHPRFVCDHHVMFEKDEIESLLRRFGDFDCISGTSLLPVANEDVGDKSVYRVLRKPR